MLCDPFSVALFGVCLGLGGGFGLLWFGDFLIMKD